MLKQTSKNHSSEQDEVELSRRSFFGRLAIGAVLSIAMPGTVHADKTKIENDKKHQALKTSGSSARLPKNGSKKTSLKKHKAGSSKHHAKLDNKRVRDVYTGKKGSKAIIQHASPDHHASKQTIVRAAHREPLIAHGRLATHRDLALQNPHTGDKLKVTYFEKGRYLNDALDEISHLLRDYRTGDVHAIDPDLLDQLHDLKQILGLSQAFGVICGYRSPITNAKLHAEHKGVANNSFHMYGKAVDIRIERFDLRRVHNAAIAMHRGGVGYYPGSNFIHLDTGTFRTWSL